MRRLLVIICLVIIYKSSSSTSTETPELPDAGDDKKILVEPESRRKGESSRGGETKGDDNKTLMKPELASHIGEAGENDKSDGPKGPPARTESIREVTVNHGVAKEHQKPQMNTGELHQAQPEGQTIEGHEVSPDDHLQRGDNAKDEILEVKYRLPEGKPWKEERYTSDWLYSEKYPVLTVEVHWHCPFYVVEGAKEPENKRKRSEDDECVTTAELKYRHEIEGSATDVLLDTYRITYIPTYVLQEHNVLKYIVPQKVENYEITVNIVLRAHSDMKTCEQFTYVVQGKGATVTKGECKKEDSLTTTEWTWEKEDDNEDEDFNLESYADAQDQDEEEEDHVNSPHEYDHGNGSDQDHDDHDVGGEDSTKKKPPHKDVAVGHGNDSDIAHDGHHVGGEDSTKMPSHKDVAVGQMLKKEEKAAEDKTGSHASEHPTSR